jgi:hypothetical protein
MAPSLGASRIQVWKGVFRAESAKYPLTLVSECAIQEESAGERGHRRLHVYGAVYTKGLLFPFDEQTAMRNEVDLLFSKVQVFALHCYPPPKETSAR